MKIYIDPGHGGIATGEVYGERQEQADNYALAIAVRDLLYKQKQRVIVSHRENDTPVVEARASQANEWGADYFISLHRDAIVPNLETGATAWVCSTAEKNGEEFNKAERILDLVCEATGLKNRGVCFGRPNRTDFETNSLTKMPSCLIFIGYIDNDEDNERFDKYFDALAAALTQGLCEAVGTEYVPDAEVEKAPIVDYEAAYEKIKEELAETKKELKTLRDAIKNIIGG